MVRSSGMGGMSSSPRNGRFRIDRRRKGLGGGLGPAEPLNKKVRQAGGSTIGSEIAFESASHFCFEQVDLRIFAFSASDDNLFFEHPHAAQ